MTTPAAGPKYTQRSSFVVAMAALLHNGDFIGAAETLERSLLKAGITVGEALLPPAARPVADAVAPALEDEVVQLTEDELAKAAGRPANQVSGPVDVEAIGGAVAKALLPQFAPMLSALEKIAAKL